MTIFVLETKSTTDGPCTVAANKALALLHSPDSFNYVGVTVPNCDSDGYYAGKQYVGSQ